MSATITSEAIRMNIRMIRTTQPSPTARHPAPRPCPGHAGTLRSQDYVEGAPENVDVWYACPGVAEATGEPGVGTWRCTTCKRDLAQMDWDAEATAREKQWPLVTQGVEGMRVLAAHRRMQARLMPVIMLAMAGLFGGILFLHGRPRDIVMGVSDLLLVGVNMANAVFGMRHRGPFFSVMISCIAGAALLAIAVSIFWGVWA